MAKSSAQESCPFCQKILSKGHIHAHVSNTPACHAARRRSLATLTARMMGHLPLPAEPLSPQGPGHAEAVYDQFPEGQVPDDHPGLSFEAHQQPPDLGSFEPDDNGGYTPSNDGPVVEPFGGQAGKLISGQRRPTLFDCVASAVAEVGGDYGPFASESDWEFGKWIAKNVGHGKADELLKLEYVSARFACDYMRCSVVRLLEALATCHCKFKMSDSLI